MPRQTSQPLCQGSLISLAGQQPRKARRGASGVARTRFVLSHVGRRSSVEIWGSRGVISLPLGLDLPLLNLARPTANETHPVNCDFRESEKENLTRSSCPESRPISCIVTLSAWDAEAQRSNVSFRSNPFSADRGCNNSAKHKTTATLGRAEHHYPLPS